MTRTRKRQRHIETSGGTTAEVTIGHIENEEYAADQSFAVNNNTNFVQWLDDYTGFVVVRITGSITKLYSVAATRDGVTQAYRQQPVLERIAYIPTLTTMGGSSTSAWGLWTLQRDRVGNGAGTALTNMASMYVECANLRSLDLSGFHTPNVATMANAFDGCMALKELDLRHFDTGKVTTLSNMFVRCYSIQSIDLRGWNTENVTTMVSMFQDCRRLQEIRGLEGFDTGIVTTMATMFSECRSIKELNVEDFDTGNITTMASMFNCCYSLGQLDLHKWDVILLP